MLAPMSHFFSPTYIIAVLIAIAVHEGAHAWMARQLGDHTAEDAGRLTLNPISHLDPLGALMFLFVGFGWAKPVPVNPLHFRHPKRDMALTAFAGPASNFLLALGVFVALSLLSGTSPLSIGGLLRDAEAATPVLTVSLRILRDLLFVNLALMAFNLFPVAPLDGSSVLRMFIPLRYEARYEDFLRIGPFVLLGLILLENFLPVRILSVWVFGIMQAVLSFFASVMFFL